MLLLGAEGFRGARLCPGTVINYPWVMMMMMMMGMVWSMARTSQALDKAASRTKTDLVTLHRPDQSHNP